MGVTQECIHFLSHLRHVVSHLIHLIVKLLCNTADNLLFRCWLLFSSLLQPLLASGGLIACEVCFPICDWRQDWCSNGAKRWHARRRDRRHVAVMHRGWLVHEWRWRRDIGSSIVKTLSTLPVMTSAAIPVHGRARWSEHSAPGTRMVVRHVNGE